MPWRAFLVFNSSSVILPPFYEIVVSMPWRAFLVFNIQFENSHKRPSGVSMPWRAFLVFNLLPHIARCSEKCVSMPWRAFLVFNTERHALCSPCYAGSQCPDGHFLFLTGTFVLSEETVNLLVSMPWRAFLVFNKNPQYPPLAICTSQCPDGHFLFLTVLHSFF